MSFRYIADKSIIEKAILKLKSDGGISPDARIVNDSCDCFRKDVLYKDPDFQFYLGNKIPVGRLADYRDDIEAFMTRYKKFGRVAPDACFDYDNPGMTRKEVLYTDGYFLNCLGEEFEEEITDSILEMLKRNKIVNGNVFYDKQKFASLRSEVKRTFQVPGTSMTPVMERLLYMLSSIRRPRKMLGIGIYCGYTLVWSAGSSCGSGKVYDIDRVWGVDINEESIKIAKDNFKKLCHADKVELIAEDGCAFIDKIDDTFDYIYLDAEDKEIGKGLNYILLKKLYGKLEKDSWVLTHDITHPYFKEQFREYLQFVGDKNNFSESISFDIDLFGLELSIK